MPADSSVVALKMLAERVVIETEPPATRNGTGLWTSTPSRIIARSEEDTVMEFSFEEPLIVRIATGVERSPAHETSPLRTSIDPLLMSQVTMRKETTLANLTADRVTRLKFDEVELQLGGSNGTRFMIFAHASQAFTFKLCRTA
jgi:hypothetical protein